MESIEKRVYELYWEKDLNCARTMLVCLGELFDMTYPPQVLDSAIGLHGAGGYRAQCGLVEGALLFIGIYYSALGKSEPEITSVCYQYADAFTKRFGSLLCYDLRPAGFSATDPPHLCETLTCRAVEFTCHFIKTNQL